MGRAEYTGRFRHEVNAAEDDVVRLKLGGGLLGQQVGVPLKVCVLNDFFTLVMMTQD